MTAYRDINAALPALMKRVLVEGKEAGSRNGRTKELTFQHFSLTEPTRREILLPSRKASLPAQIAETMWVLGGRGDVSWLRNYLPRAADYSDDGERWRGAYGPRIRSWDGERDQLAHVINLLKDHPATRRAVISIYNPTVDSEPGKDIPCNNWLHFLSREGKLDLHVAIRSNDLMWGWSGINAFEWSVLLEVVAHLTGLLVGSVHFSISSLHLYDQHWSKAQRIGKERPLPYATESDRFDLGDYSGSGITTLDWLIDKWFQIEGLIRSGDFDKLAVADFPEPMMRSWLYVLAWWHTEDHDWLDGITGTPLYTATILSPPKPAPVIHEDDTLTISGNLNMGPGIEFNPTELRIFDDKGEVTDKGYVEFNYDAPGVLQKIAPTPLKPSFLEYVKNLHREKNAVYGDSWKKRGEDGILANIARKADRLGVEGGGDTAADTAVDMLVYLVKYEDWLGDPGCENHVLHVEESLERIDDRLQNGDGTAYPGPNTIQYWFGSLEKKIANGNSFADKYESVRWLAEMVYKLAQHLWEKEQQ